MNFERQIRNSRSVPLTPLIDIVFLLLIFFMVSTSFVRTESLELSLPQAGNKQVSNTNKLLQIYVTKDGFMYIGRTPVNEQRLIATLKETISRHPDINIILLSGKGVNVQQLVTVMDRIYLAGGKNLSIAYWEPKGAAK